MFKKIATILLLLFLFFNWVGYWLFISFCESHSETHWQQRPIFDARLIVIKVSAGHLPYSNASVRFEQTEGKVDIGSMHYRYVAKRLYNDSVEYLCLPDPEADRLQTARNELFSFLNDQQNTGHTKVPGTSGKATGNQLKICYPGDTYSGLYFLSERVVYSVEYHIAGLSSGFTRIKKQPPKIAGLS